MNSSEARDCTLPTNERSSRRPTTFLARMSMAIVLTSWTLEARMVAMTPVQWMEYVAPIQSTLGPSWPLRTAKEIPRTAHESIMGATWCLR